MATNKPSLRERLLSNSPDPMKDSILRESGMGWNTATPAEAAGSISSTTSSSSSSSTSIVSPLRIAKRDSPGQNPRRPPVARRSSSSYKHMHTNNLVSKSPFKSQIPTPSAAPIAITFPNTTTTAPMRRVSSEKRPRPDSLHEGSEIESERPFAYKRDRKQSKTFEGLLQKEAVTKSPFRRSATVDEGRSTPPVTRPRPHSSYIPESTPEPEHMAVPQQLPERGPSPGRSVLVSRRMHGPRLSGSGRRERRKTVTFDERCDVVEFDRDEESDEDVFVSDEDEDVFYEGDGEDLQHSGHPTEDDDDSRMDIDDDDDASFEGVSLNDDEKKVDTLLTLDTDASITGIVDKMFFSPKDDARTSTPPRHSSLPPDAETEDGVPLGRSHHVDRFLQHQQEYSHLQQPPRFSPRASPQSGAPRGSGSYPFGLGLPSHASPHGAPATPPRRSPGMTHSTPPLGRSTHSERSKQAREDEKDEEASREVSHLPPSPSPMKPTRRESVENGLVPRFDLARDINPALPSPDVSTDADINPFDPSLNLDGSDEEANTSTEIDRAADDSTSRRDTSLSQLLDPLGLSANEGNNEPRAARPLPAQPRTPPVTIPLEIPSGRSSPFARGSPSVRASSPFTRGASPFARAASASPLPRSGSPLTRGLSPVTSPEALRPRISKEDVKRRLLGRRSPGDPSSPSTTPDDGAEARASPIPAVQESSDPTTPVAMELPDHASVMTEMSMETSVLVEADRANMSTASVVSAAPSEHNEFGQRASDRLKFDFGSKFSLGGLGISTGDEADVSLPPSHSGERSSSRLGSTERTEMRMGDKDVDMEMKSALDQLMEDVAGGPVDDSIMTDDSFASLSSSASEPFLPSVVSPPRPKVIERAATDSVLIESHQFDGILSRSVSGSSSATIPPPVPPKDSIKNREQLILEKRRAARRMEDDDSEDFDDVGDLRASHKAQSVGRPSRRRSMSTNDAVDLAAQRRSEALLDINAESDGDDLLGKIEQELNKGKEQPKKRYQIREHNTIYASSSSQKVSHTNGAGDVDAGRAWRMVRRPSDMNEYAQQIREYRNQEKGKAYGKVFVKVLSVKGVHLPLPHERTFITCTLNNGIHFVTTPESQLAETSAIEQEFELIEHSKLEFTLTVKVRRDPHIAAQFQALVAPPPSVPSAIPRAPPMAQSHSKSSSVFSLFSSSPRKPKDKHRSVPPPVAAPPPAASAPHRLPENLARYLKPDGTMARAFISFKDVVHRCDTRLFETSYPLIGQRAELGGKYSTQQVGEIVLQMFRLPPLPGIPQDQLPQSLEECHRGLRHINWHKMTYFQGTLTQNGGDVSTWRRRQFRVIGGNLVAFNDVTKKATATIDLKKAIALEDDADHNDDRYESAMYGVERSFRLIFPAGEEIMFFADTDEEKNKWLEVLRALVGHIPPHPLWAELLWQRQEELTKPSAAAKQVATPHDPSAVAGSSSHGHGR
ncbi:hypothetical protein BKA70DRAFT_1558314 [Coprinopsis sp. MPI-PUGE-AT-0042]|nr:hypothetical protein BKA70DRAFT_1558314 [Coprinopsis sp. MPI-PUGE-AT-0042]